MKPFLCLLITGCFCPVLQAQNVGIGVTNPAYPLTVQGNADGRGITVKNGSLEAGLYNNGSAAYIQTWTPHDLFFATNNGGSKIALNNSTGYVGINVAVPAAQLDVFGTVRLRTGASNGAILTSDASGNATWQPRNEVYSVGSNDFRAQVSSNPVTINSSGVYYSTAVYGNLVAPVHFPNGVTVTQVLFCSSITQYGRYSI